MKNYMNEPLYRSSYSVIINHKFYHNHSLSIEVDSEFAYVFQNQANDYRIVNPAFT